MASTLQREFSRNAFLRGGGALIVGFSVAGVGLTATAGGAGTAAPALNSLDSWLIVHADNTVTVLGEKLEYGQGTTTGLRQIAAEELGIGMSQVRWVRPQTGIQPNQGGTYGSNGTASGGPQIRAAAAFGAQALLGLASTQLSVPAASLTVADGVVSGGGKSVKYSDLLAGKVFNVTMPVTTLAPGVAPAKAPGAYTLVGTRVPRVDIPDKVTGTFTYMHNVRVPGMLHGRIVRPHGQAAYGTGAPIISVDQASISHIPNAQIVRKGDFLGVVAPHEYDAIQAAAQLKVKWQETPTLPSSGDIWTQMRAQDAAGLTTNSIRAITGDVGAGLASAAQVMSATYKVAYQTHGPIGPSCAIADVRSGSATVLCSTQDIYVTQTRLSLFLGLTPDQITVQYWDGASTFGASGYQDVADAAALMSQAVGKPVRVQFMRWDETGWDTYGPAVVADIRAGIDAKGNIVAYDSIAFGHPQVPYAGTGANETSAELAGLARGPIGTGNVGVDAGTRYTIPNFRVIGKSVPSLNGYLMTSYLRRPNGPQNMFMSEQTVDELAHMANMDPIAFRLQNLNAGLNAATTQTGARTVTVLNTLAQLAKWQPRVAASQLSKGDVMTGRGVAITGQQGLIAEVEVNKKTGKLKVTHMYVVQEPGLVVNPASAENQLIGNMVMGASRAVVEAVKFSKVRVTSTDWVTYPILRFKDSPKVTTAMISRTDQPPSGVGEATHETVPAAIANAFFDATGVRIREYPMSPPVVRATLKAAGVA
jgi:CO/xanthine dehydrogenase Mo-binding subunit